MDKLRLADKDTPILHMVNDMWANMIGEVKARVFKHERKDILTDKSEFFDLLEEILEERRQKSITPLHCVAHSLCPKYYTTSWLGGGGKGMTRVAPNQDSEVSKNRATGFERLFSSDVRMDVSVEFGKFCTSSGYYSQLNVIGDMDVCEPREWWGVHGFNSPMLQNLSHRLLGQPSSSSSCERNWSTYARIHSIKRNKLACQRAEDLVFVHTNLRLLSRQTPEYKDGPSKYWDVAVEDDFSDEPGYGCLNLDDEYILMNFEDNGVVEKASTQAIGESSSSGNLIEDLTDFEDED